MKQNPNIVMTGLCLLTAGEVFAAACTTPPDCASLGYTMSASQCEGVSSLKCPTDSSKVWCDKVNTNGLSVGDILYSDKTTSPIVIKGKTPIGVVVSVEQRFAISLDEALRTWIEPESFPSQVKDRLSGTGKARTKILHDFYGADAPAAEYCYTYKTEGTKAGDWFLPSYYELSQIYIKDRRRLHCSFDENIFTLCTEKGFVPFSSALPLPTRYNKEKLICDASPKENEVLNCELFKYDVENRRIDVGINFRDTINQTLYKLELLQIPQSPHWTSNLHSKYNFYTFVTFFDVTVDILSPDGVPADPAPGTYQENERVANTRCFIKF